MGTMTLPSPIAAKLGATQLEVQQTLSVYLFSFAVMTLWHGAISDRFGRRRLLGVALAGVISWLWVRFGQKVNLSRFFRVTSWFMMVFAVQLVIYALHEFTESGLVPGIDNAWWHLATEDLAEGWIAQVIAVGMVLLPTLWLLGAHLMDRRGPVRDTHAA